MDEEQREINRERGHTGGKKRMKNSAWEREREIEREGTKKKRRHG